MLMCAVNEQGYSLRRLTAISMSRHTDRQTEDVKLQHEVCVTLNLAASWAARGSCSDREEWERKYAAVTGVSGKTRKQHRVLLGRASWCLLVVPLSDIPCQTGSVLNSNPCSIFTTQINSTNQSNLVPSQGEMN